MLMSSTIDRAVDNSSATTARRKSNTGLQSKTRRSTDIVVRVSAKTVLLGAVGVGYGVLISHLHDRQQIAPVKIEGIKRESWIYLAFWGVVAVALGQIMPWLDGLWNSFSDDEENDVIEKQIKANDSKVGDGASFRPGSEVQSRRTARQPGVPEWYDAVRSIGAFVGIAFAIVSILTPIALWKRH